MAAANTEIIDKVFAHAGQLRGVPVAYTGPASYDAGGDLLTAQQLGLKNIYAIGLSPTDDGVQYVMPLFTANKAVQSLYLMWITVATGAEASGDLSGQIVRLMVWGN